MSWQRRIERADQLAALSPVLPELLYFYREIAHFQATIAGDLALASLEQLRAFLRRTSTDDPMHLFFARVLQQANTARQPGNGCGHTCPLCGERPVAVVLRDAGRFLLCGACFGEWEIQDARCLACGQHDAGKCRLQTDAELLHVCIEACENCRVYVKVVDMTCDPLAVPEVDELATVMLDVWACEQGYRKLQPNLFGL